MNILVSELGKLIKRHININIDFINKEKEYILTLFDEIDRSASVLSRFQNISLQSLKDNGYISKTNGFELVSVNAPTPTRLEATYNNLKNN